MAPHDPNPPEKTPDRPSFVERLHRHFGPDVDPKITLQDAGEDEDEGEARSAEDSQSSSGTSRGLLKKLSEQVPVASRYEVKRELARGGMGTIFRVWDDDLRRNLAMKVMHGHGRLEDESSVSGDDEEKLGRFLEEAQITGQLDHPGVVPVHDLGIDNEGRCFFTMRLVRGRELKDVLDLVREGKEGWTITRALAVILKVCEAMAFAHSKGVVHRDLKPSNVMVGRFGETYVMDWGLARVIGKPGRAIERTAPEDGGSSLSLVRTVRRDESEANPDSPLITMDGDVVGTPAYMALEQAQGRLEDLGERSDVYSLGTILYYMLTGRSPYVEPGERVSPHTVLNRVLEAPPVPASKLAADMPSELVAICEKAMSRHAEDRYATMLDLAGDIQAYLEDRVVSAYEGGSFAQFRKWVSRNRRFSAALAGLILLLITFPVIIGVQKSLRVTQIAEEQKKTAAEQVKTAAALEEAKEQRALADRRREEADHNARLAEEESARARLSGYQSSLIAADSSLRIEEVVEARRILQDCEEEMRGWEWHHLALKCRAALLTRSFGLRTALDVVAFSPDGTHGLGFNRSGKLNAHDFASGEDELRHDIKLSFTAVPRRVVMDLSRDGSRVFLAGRDDRIRVFDRAGVVTSQILPPNESGIAAHDGSRVSAVALSPSGRWLASGAENGGILIWDGDPDRVAIEHRLTAHQKAITGLAWAPDSSRLASSSTDGTVRIWDVRRGTVLRVLKGHAGAVHQLAWDGWRGRVVTAGADGVVNLWDASDGILLSSYAGSGAAVLTVDVDPGSGLVVLGGEDRTLRLWDPATREAKVLLGHSARVLSACFSPNGDRILSGSEDGEMKLWDVRGDLATTALEQHDAQVQAVAFHPGGRVVATSVEAGAILLSDADTGFPLRRLIGHVDDVTCLTFSADGRLLLSTSRDRTARLWSVATGEVVQVLSGHDRWLDAGAISPDGTFVLTGSGDKAVRRWDVLTGEVLDVYRGHRYSVGAVAIAPDGKTFASAGRRILLHAVEGDRDPIAITTHNGRVRDLAFSPDGEYLATVSIHGETWLWDARTGEEIAGIKDHERQARAVAFTPDGSRLATCSDDGTIRVREARTGETLLILRGHDDDILDLDFNADGTRLLSGAADGTALVWETAGRVARRMVYLRERELRDKVLPLVEDLFARLSFRDEVRQALATVPGLEAEALATAHILVDLHAPRLLAGLSRRVTELSGRTAREYGIALLQAREARRLDPSNPTCWLAEGLAEYRAGNYRRTKELLDPLGDGRNATGPSIDTVENPDQEAVRLLFIALAYDRTGDAATARSYAGAADRWMNLYAERLRGEFGLENRLAAIAAELPVGVRGGGAHEGRESGPNR